MSFAKKSQPNFLNATTLTSSLFSIRYKGEIAFFDDYIIPLIQNLKESGLFGASIDFYLRNALNNRKLWERKGVSIVDNYVKRFEDIRSKARSLRRDSVCDQVADLERSADC